VSRLLLPWSQDILSTLSAKQAFRSRIAVAGQTPGARRRRFPRVHGHVPPRARVVFLPWRPADHATSRTHTWSCSPGFAGRSLGCADDVAHALGLPVAIVLALVTDLQAAGMREAGPTGSS